MIIWGLKSNHQNSIHSCCSVTDVAISLECEYLNVSESQGYVEACAILNEGVLGIPAEVAMSTSFGTADGE